MRELSEMNYNNFKLGIEKETARGHLLELLVEKEPRDGEALNIIVLFLCNKNIVCYIISL